MNQQIQKGLHELVRASAVLLLFSYLASLCARLHWSFDLFSHFTIQYAIGGLILGLTYLALKKKKHACLMFLVMAASAIETRLPMHEPMSFSKPQAEANFTVMHYNKLFRNKRYPKVREFLNANAKDIDIILVQESGVVTIEELKQFKDIFPHQFPENKADRFNDVSVLSKYPFKLTSIPLPLEIEAGWFSAAASRIKITKPGIKPLVIYSFHTAVPFGDTYSRHRNGTLAQLAAAIKEDETEYIIASGDWNITPYSPYFADFLETSGLRYQNYGLLPETTWPAPLLLPFMKIPIDHIVYKDGLTLTGITHGPAMGSDHHSLIAKFAIPAE